MDTEYRLDLPRMMADWYRWQDRESMESVRSAFFMMLMMMMIKPLQMNQISVLNCPWWVDMPLIYSAKSNQDSCYILMVQTSFFKDLIRNTIVNASLLQLSIAEKMLSLWGTLCWHCDDFHSSEEKMTTCFLCKHSAIMLFVRMRWFECVLLQSLMNMHELSNI